MQRARLPLFGLLALSLACGPSIGEADGGMDGDGTAGPTDSITSSDPPTADSTGEGSDPGSLGMAHGVVSIQLLRGRDDEIDPFVGTARVEITLLYRDCLIAFYEANPSWQQQGADGSVVFDAALGAGLCDPSDPELVDCTVAQIVQTLDATQSLTVVHEVTGTLDEGLLLRVGPLPDHQLAACPEGGSPIVRIGSTEAVRGFDAADALLWTTEAYNPAEAATDQGQSIRVRVTVP